MSNEFDLNKALSGAPIWVMRDKAWLFQSKSNPSFVFIEYTDGRNTRLSFSDLLNSVEKGKIKMWEGPVEKNSVGNPKTFER